MKLYFFIALLISIIVHELGHLIAAKLCRCKVEIFSVGFGKPLFKKRIGQTIYQFCPFLLGGYCQLEDELKYSQSPTAFSNLPYRKKVLISYAGIIINNISGLIAMCIFWQNQSYLMYVFGSISIILAITNALPIPALDGSYPFLILLEKIMEKQKAYKIIERICKIGFIIIMTLNIICIPFIFLIRG